MGAGDSDRNRLCEAAAGERGGTGGTALAVRSPVADAGKQSSTTGPPTSVAVPPLRLALIGGDTKLLPAQLLLLLRRWSAAPDTSAMDVDILSTMTSRRLCLEGEPADVTGSTNGNKAESWTTGEGRLLLAAAAMEPGMGPFMAAGAAGAGVDLDADAAFPGLERGRGGASCSAPPESSIRFRCESPRPLPSRWTGVLRSPGELPVGVGVAGQPSLGTDTDEPVAVVTGVLTASVVGVGRGAAVGAVWPPGDACASPKSMSSPHLRCMLYKKLRGFTSRWMIPCAWTHSGRCGEVRSRNASRANL